MSILFSSPYTHFVMATSNSLMSHKAYCKSSSEFTMLKWPPQSHDLKTTQHLWDLVEWEIHIMDVQMTNLQQEIVILNRPLWRSSFSEGKDSLDLNQYLAHLFERFRKISYTKSQLFVNRYRLGFDCFLKGPYHKRIICLRIKLL